MGSSNFPSRPFRLRDSTSVARQEVGNNRSLLDFAVYIDKLSYSPTWSAQGKANRSYKADGHSGGSSSTPGWDFRGAGPWKILSGQTWVTHNANGTKTATIEVAADYDLLGATSFSYSMALPTIPRNKPPAPTSVRIDQITRTSMRYVFTGNGDGGSPITRWEYQVSDNANFTGWAPITATTTGTNTRTGLTPGHEYWFRSRGVNAVGAGSWSAAISARTLSGAWISVSGVWVPAEVLISRSGAWQPAEVLISRSGAWVPSA